MKILFFTFGLLVMKTMFKTSNAELSVQDDYFRHIHDVCSSDTFLLSV